MGDPDHIRTLQQGVDAWNAWKLGGSAPHEVDLRGADLGGADLGGVHLLDADLRKANLKKANLSRAILSYAKLGKVNLREADLSHAELTKADLTGAELFEANLSGANLCEANLSAAILTNARLSEAKLYRASFSRAEMSWAKLGRVDLRDAHFHGAHLYLANLSGANLHRAVFLGADLTHADLSEANLRGAEFGGADLTAANLRGADLSEASLQGAMLVAADLRDANLTGCNVYGTSVWDIKLNAATKQQNLIITHSSEPAITVDNLEVAQFVYLLLANAKIREVIDSITAKAVLILGRFTAERKMVLDALRDQLRERGYLPILFDFDKPNSKDLTGTVSTLAHMVRFIIADGTDPKSIPYELASIVPSTFVPVQPILLSGKREFSMFSDLQRRYHWVLATYHYDNLHHLLADLSDRVIGPAEAKAHELRAIIASVPPSRIR